MKILQINNCHYRRGGADVVYFNTGKLLEEKGNEVYYFSLEDDKNESSCFSEYFPERIDYRKESIFKKFYSIPTFIYNKEASKKLKDLLSKYNPDVAHIHLYLGGLSVSILRTLKENRIPIIVTVHDYRLICPAYTFLDGNKEICELCKDGNYYRCAIKKCSLEQKFTHSAVLAADAYFRKHFCSPIKYISHFIFVSNFCRNKHIQFNQNYCKNSSVVYNFNQERYDQISDVKNSYFLYLGRLSHEKGISTLISAANELKIELRVVGDGPMLKNYKRQDFKTIKFQGYKSGLELKNFIKNASFVVIPSEWYENNPLSVIESFSLGKPVIGANIGGIPELINDEGNGYIFESKSIDSLSQTLSKASNISTQEYFSLSKNALNFANSHFNKERHYKTLMKIYHDAINTKTCE